MAENVIDEIKGDVRQSMALDSIESRCEREADRELSSGEKNSLLFVASNYNSRNFDRLPFEFPRNHLTDYQIVM